MSTPAPTQVTLDERKSSFEEKAQHEEIGNHGLQIDEAVVASHAPSMRGRMLTIAVAFVAGTGFTLFG